MMHKGAHAPHENATSAPGSKLIRARSFSASPPAFPQANAFSTVSISTRSDLSWRVIGGMALSMRSS